MTPPTPETLERTATDELATPGPADDVIEEVLVEEISIDGMCGVY